MLGAIIGDIIGSRFEFRSTKDTDFKFFDPHCYYTDDSVMTIAVSEWLIDDPRHTNKILEEKLVKYGNFDPRRGYGGTFFRWLFSPRDLNSDGIRRPYNSFGNGSAMRVSSVGWMFDTLDETERVAEISSSITHNHPEGIKGAQSTAAAIFMARNGKSKEEIKNYITTRYGYNLDRSIDEIRPDYRFDVSCQGSVPESIIAFLDGSDYESVVRLAVSLGGDSDTQACIAGGIAEAFYGIPDNIIEQSFNYLPKEYETSIINFGERSAYKSHIEQIKNCWKL